MKRYTISGERIEQDDGVIKEHILYVPVEVPRVPPPDLPFAGDPIIAYVGSEMVDIEPDWPQRFNTEVANWTRRRDLRVPLPGSAGELEVPKNPKYQPPTMTPEGKISWNHTGIPDHSQVRLRSSDARMATNGIYLQPGQSYGLVCECVYANLGDWINMLQLYGRVHPDLGGDGQKDVTAFLHRTGGLFGNVYGNSKPPNQGPRSPIEAGVSLRLALEVKSGTAQGRGDYCKFWFAQGEPHQWLELYDYDGSVGTGQVVRPPDNHLVPNWGPYTKSGLDLGTVVYDNLAIYEVSE